MSAPSFCDQCGSSTALTDSNCPACGSDLPILRVPERKTLIETAITLLKPSIKYWPFAAAAAGIFLLAPSSRSTGGNQSQDWGVILLLSSPLIAGWVIALTQSVAVGRQLERIEIWMARHREAAKSRDGSVSRWVLRPMFWTFAQISTATSRISDAHIRAGVQFAAYIYFVMIVLYLAIVATMIILLLIGLAIASLIFRLYESSGAPRAYRSERQSKPKSFLAGTKGSTVIKGTNILNESKAGRVDIDGRIYEGTNILNEKLVGRIDDAGNVYQGTNILNESKAGRISDDGRIYQGTNIFTEEHTGRIDSEGNVYEGTNILNEKAVGKIQEKK